MLTPVPESTSDELARLRRENAELRYHLAEAEDTLHALRSGEADAIVMGEDIYTLESAEAAANRFRSDVLAQMEDAVMVLDPEGRIVYLNPAAERQYEMTSSAALGRLAGDLYTPAWPEPRDEAAAQRELLANGSWRGRQVHHLRSGQALLVEATHTRLQDTRDAGTAVLLVVRDLSGQAAAEAALRESRARLDFALDSARIGDWSLDLQNGQSLHSLRHDQCFGYREPATEWSLDILLRHVHIDDRDSVVQALQRAAAGGVDEHLECRVIWPDATEHWIELHATAVCGNGPPRRLVGIVSDVTQRKQAEAALREADNRKDVFLATLAHELRNPLAPIRNAVRILRLPGQPQLHERALSTLERQLEQMVLLLNDLMDVSRISRGKMDLRPATVDIAEVLRDAIDSTQPQIDRKGHMLELRLPPQPVLITGDPTRLTQVMVNLLDNAAKYSPDGGRIVVTVQPQGEQLLVQVQDNGIGIHPAMLPQVFDMFTQVKRRTGAANEGMGIGLALVKRLVEMHGGTIAARSEGEACGSTMEMRLPMHGPATTDPRTVHGAECAAPQATATPAATIGAMPTTPEPEPDTGPHPRPAEGCRVLVAEDNADSADSMEMLLQIMGHETALARDGLQAVALARDFKPQVVLMDIGLPGCDGYEAARRIREQPGGADILLIALTGWGQEADRERSSQAGMDLHLVKPVDPDRLEAMLKKVCAQAHRLG